MNDDEVKKLHDAMLAPDDGELTDAPYTEEELEVIRARARGDQPAEELLCIDHWAEELQPKNHQLRPGYLMVKGAAVAGGCKYVLFDYLRFITPKQLEGWKRWSQMTLTHKKQCLACRLGTSVL